MAANICEIDGFKFIVTNDWEAWRAETLLTKEMGTIAWIRSEAKPGDVFYDIGACAGSYTMVAGREVGPEGVVYAFEPNANNISHLFANIHLNKYLDRVEVITSALGDQEGFFRFFYSSHTAGTSGAQLYDTVMENGQNYIPAAAEIKHATTVDRLLDEQVIRPANLIKLDVDGDELRILNGMAALLKHRPPRSIQVEIHPIDDAAIGALLAGFGYTFKERHFTEMGKTMIASGVDPTTISHNAVFCYA